MGINPLNWQWTCTNEGNTGSDAAPVPFMDDEEADDDIIPEEETDPKDLGPNIQQLPDAVPEVSTFPIQQHAEAIFIPPTPPTSNLSKSEELSSTAEDDVVTSGVEVHPDPSPSEACPNLSPTIEEESLKLQPETDIKPDSDENDVKIQPDEKSCQNEVAISSKPVIPLSISGGILIGRLPSLPTNSSTTMSSIDLEIPPPPSHCDLKDQPSIESSSSTTVSPPPPPPMLLDGTEGSGPPTAVSCPPPVETEGAFPFPPRTLSRISEGGSTLAEASNTNNTKVGEGNDQLICSQSGSEGGPDTMTDQNCTTSEDAEYDNNPPSLNSDLPENLGIGGGGAVMRAIAEFESRNLRQENQKQLYLASDSIQHQNDSKDLPSPPSSMINTTTEEVTQEGKTEVTLVDSLYLELSPNPQLASKQWDIFSYSC